MKRIAGYDGLTLVSTIAPMNANDCQSPRISCLAALETAACAAFIKESRMECASATNTNRKSGTAVATKLVK
jgi:hypothetical protein